MKNRIRFFLDAMRAAYKALCTGEGFVIISERDLIDLHETRDDAQMQADRLWQVVDDLIAGKSACAHCELESECRLTDEDTVGCNDWCLKFEEADADEGQPD